MQRAHAYPSAVDPPPQEDLTTTSLSGASASVLNPLRQAPPVGRGEMACSNAARDQDTGVFPSDRAGARAAQVPE